MGFLSLFGIVGNGIGFRRVGCGVGCASRAANTTSGVFYSPCWKPLIRSSDNPGKPARPPSQRVSRWPRVLREYLPRHSASLVTRGDVGCRPCRAAEHESRGDTDRPTRRNWIRAVTSTAMSPRPAPPPARGPCAGTPAGKSFDGVGVGGPAIQALLRATHFRWCLPCVVVRGTIES